MKIRTDFVTNSSSSSFTLEIGFQLVNGQNIIFKGEGATGEIGPTAYFDNEAVMTVSPRQLGLAQNIDELIQMLADGVLSGNSIDIKYNNLEETTKIFEKSNPREYFDYEAYEEKIVDAYDFIKEIKDTVKSMDDIESITIKGNEENFESWQRIYNYNLKTGKYTFKEIGEEPYEREGDAGGDLQFSDDNLADKIDR